MPYIIIALLVIGVVGFTFLQSGNEAATIPPVTEEVTEESITSPSVEAEANLESVEDDTSVNANTELVPPAVDESANTSYEDGTYLTQVTYQTPARVTYALDVSLTINGDVVTGSTITYSQGAEKDPNAKRFEDAYKTEVIGKKLDSINLSRVGGASLTTGAFNKALVSIKADAKN